MIQKNERYYLSKLYMVWVKGQKYSYELYSDSCLAKQLGISGAAYSKIKNGETKGLSLNFVIAFCQSFNVDYETFIKHELNYQYLNKS